jgi:hypothetical protein
LKGIKRARGCDVKGLKVALKRQLEGNKKREGCATREGLKRRLEVTLNTNAQSRLAEAGTPYTVKECESIPLQRRAHLIP